MKQSQRRVVVKIGSNVLTDTNGNLDTQRIEELVRQIATLYQKGIEVVLVSSGAVAAGRSLVKLPSKTDVISIRQTLAAVGQVKLLNIYSKLFDLNGITIAQVLVTKEDFRDRSHYLNMKNCITTLIQNRIIPIINENDVISITELMFTDNDELAGLISSMVTAGKLIILSNIDGIYNGSPNDPKAKVINEINYNNGDYTRFITTEKSSFGRGGMLTKCAIAHKVAGLGIPVQIANGKTDNILVDILANKKATGTIFLQKKNASSVKKWIAHSDGFEKGTVYVDAGAEKALLAKNPTSLLPIGVIKIEGNFKKGDVIKICSFGGKNLGVGRAEYNSEKANELKEKKNEKALIHYDYLFLNKD